MFKLKNMDWYFSESGSMVWEGYLGRYEIYLNKNETWTFDSGEYVSEHDRVEGALNAAVQEHKRRLSTLMDAEVL